MKEKTTKGRNASQEQESINNILNVIAKDTECYFYEAIKYIEMVARKENAATALIGEGGFGKSLITLYTVTRIGLKIHKDYEILSTYTTPLAFVKWLYANRNKVLLIIDDVAGLYEDNKGVSILKSGLWGVTIDKKSRRRRYISYYSTSNQASDIPPRFELKAGMILLMNKMPRNIQIRALISRMLYSEVKFKYEEIIDFMYKIAGQSYKSLTLKERLDVVNFIKSNTSKATINLSFRTLMHAFDIYEFCKKYKEDWKLLIKKQLVEDEFIALILKLARKYTRVKDQASEFMDKTGKSRATFFNYRKKIKLYKNKESN